MTTRGWGGTRLFLCSGSGQQAFPLCLSAPCLAVHSPLPLLPPSSSSFLEFGTTFLTQWSLSFCLWFASVLSLSESLFWLVFLLTVQSSVCLSVGKHRDLERNWVWIYLSRQFCPQHDACKAVAATVTVIMILIVLT